MELLVNFLRLIHVVFGGIGLISFWVPLLTRKGSQHHRRFGKIFLYSAYVMLAAAAAALIIRFGVLISEGRSPGQEPYWFALLFLLSQLVIMVFVTVRHGVMVLKNKYTPAALNTRLNRALAYLSILASALLLIYAVSYTPYNMMVLIALGLVGMISGYDILKYIGGRKAGRTAWKLEHLSAMLGAGIAYHTAFAVFGMSRIVDLSLTGWLVLLPWLLPTLLGIPAIILWTQYYRLQETSPE